LYALLDSELDTVQHRVLEDISVIEAELKRQREIQQTVHRHNAWMHLLRAFALALTILWSFVLFLHTFDSGERMFGSCLMNVRENYASSDHPWARSRICSFFYFFLTRGFNRFFARPLFALFAWLALGLFVTLFVVTGVYYMQYPVPQEAYEAANTTYNDILAREAERLRSAEEEL